MPGGSGQAGWISTAPGQAEAQGAGPDGAVVQEGRAVDSALSGPSRDSWPGIRMETIG